jgi:hypothetical protein
MSKEPSSGEGSQMNNEPKRIERRYTDKQYLNAEYFSNDELVTFLDDEY